MFIFGGAALTVVSPWFMVLEIDRESINKSIELFFSLDSYYRGIPEESSQPLKKN